MERVSFVSKISSVMKATSDDESPIAGYLYPEIAKISLESAATCENLMDFLVDRLARNSYHIKLKVLKLMKFVLENGNPNFAMGLRKHSNGIKEATSYGGPPDPLHGNIPYVLVRKAAKELSEKLFDTEVGADDTSDQRPVLRSSGGMGGSSQGHHGNPNKMEGFGNSPRPQQKSLGDTIMTGLNKLADKVSESAENRQGTVLSSMEKSYGEYRPSHVHTRTASPSRTVGTQDPPRPSIRPAPRRHVPGRPGGGWDEDPDPVVVSRDPGIKQYSDSRSDGSQGTSERFSDSFSSDDWSNEENLVKDSVESKDCFLLKRTEISSFLKKCCTVNWEKTVEIVNKRLLEGKDNITIKCLQLVESLLRCDFVNLEFIASTCQQNLVTVYSSTHPQIKAKTKKIIRILEKLTTCSSILPYNLVPLSNDFSQLEEHVEKNRGENQNMTNSSVVEDTKSSDTTLTSDHCLNDLLGLGSLSKNTVNQYQSSFTDLNGAESTPYVPSFSELDYDKAVPLGSIVDNSSPPLYMIRHSDSEIPVISMESEDENEDGTASVIIPVNERDQTDANT